MINLHTFGIPLEHLVGFEFKEKIDKCKVKYSIIPYAFPSRELATPALRGLTQIEYYSQQCEVEGANNRYTLLLDPGGTDLVVSSFNKKSKVTETAVRQKLDHYCCLLNTLLHPPKKLSALARDYITRPKDSYLDLSMEERKNIRGFEAALEKYIIWMKTHPERIGSEALEIYGWCENIYRKLERIDRSSTFQEGVPKVLKVLKRAHLPKTLSIMASNIIAENYRGIRNFRKTRRCSLSEKELEELLRTGVQQIAQYFYGYFNNSTTFKDRVDQRLKDYVGIIKKP